MTWRRFETAFLVVLFVAVFFSLVVGVHYVWRRPVAPPLRPWCP